MDSLPHRLLLLALVSACAGQEVPARTELTITPEISFLPSDKIIEGDSLRVQCMVRGPLPPNLKIHVMKGPTILKSGSQQVLWNTTLAHAADAGTYICKAEANGIQKSVSRSVHVAELFSMPVLTVQPADVSEGEILTFFCKSVHTDSQRINANDVKYRIYKDNVKVADLPSGEFQITADMHHDGNYSCQAEAKSVQKQSLVFVLKTKELFSMPVLTVQPEDVFEGEILTFSCKSVHIDSQRINANDVKYHLYKDNVKVTDLPSGEYRMFADLRFNGNYSCQAEAKSIQKRSLVFVLKTKVFTINKVTLTILPATEVQRDTDVDLKCDCDASVSKTATLTYQYSFYKYEQLMHAENHSFSHLSHRLHAVRVPTSGFYSCEVKILSATKRSEAEILRVTGVETPSLKVSSSEIFEGEELSVKCRAPKMEGPFSFNFYHNSTLLKTIPSEGNSLSTKLKFEQSGVYEVHCNYKLMLIQATSEKSNREVVTVRELTITPEISFLPSDKIVEGDSLEVHCRVRQPLPPNLSLKIFVIKGPTILNSGTKEVFWNTGLAQATDAGTYMCKAEANGIQKSVSRFMHVAVFTINKVTLTILPATEVQRDTDVELKCDCDASVSKTATLTYQYSFYKYEQLMHAENHSFSHLSHRLHAVRVPTSGLYSCEVKILSATKRSEAEILRVTGVETPSLKVSSSEIFEGEELSVKCRAPKMEGPFSFNFYHNSTLLKTIPSKGNSLSTKLKFEQSGVYEVHCNYKLMLIQATSEKSNREVVTVRELFSKRLLSMPHPDVFEGQMLTFSCKSAHIDSQRINATDVKYHLYKDNVKVRDLPSGKFQITADVHHDGNYSCQAEAKSVQKQSLVFVLKTKVLVSEPLIETWGNVILGRPFSIVCRSVRGSLPITYTLLFKGDAVSSFIVHSPQDRAIFNITSMTINSREKIRDFKCLAQNFGDKSKGPSLALNTTVTEPVSDPQLTVMPSTGNVVEGKELILFCTVKDGSPPITFEWYHNGEIINSSTKDERKYNYTLSKIEHKQGGRYYCQVQNNDMERQRSEEITVTVKNAPWKIFLTAFTIVLLLSVITISLIYCINKKAVKRKEKETEFYLKALEVKSDASVAVTPAYTGYNKASHTVVSDNVERSACQSSGSSVFYAPPGTESSDDTLLKDQKSSQEDERNPNNCTEKSALVRDEVTPTIPANCSEGAVDTGSVLYAQLNLDRENPKQIPSPP